MSRAVMTAPRPSTQTVWAACAVSFLIAAAAVEVYGALSRVAGVPMRAASIGDARASTIYPGMFAMGTFVASFWGTVIALLVARYASRPDRTYLWVTVPLAVLSLIAPTASSLTPIATKMMLSGGHVLAAAIIIPFVHRRLHRAVSPRDVARPSSAGVGGA